MNAEEYVTTALRVAADVEPGPRGLELVQAGIERRSRRARRLVPLTAAAVVLTLVAGVAALTRVDEPSVYQPARRVGDLYVDGGSIWPFQSRSAAEAWRRDPDRAPYLRDPVATIREFTRTQLGRDAVPWPFRLAPDERQYYVPGPRDGVSAAFDVSVARAPGSSGPWVVTGVLGDTGFPRPPRAGERRIVSPVDVDVTPVAARHRVAVLEPVGDGRYDVLGEAFLEGDTPEGAWRPRVEFREPRGGFGVVATYGTDATGTVQRATMVPVSFRDPWPPSPPRPPGPDSWPRIELRDGVVTVRHDAGPPYVVPPGPVVTGVAASGKDRFGIVGRRTGPCTGRLDEIVTTGGPVRPLLPVDGVPSLIAARDDRIAFAVTRCGTKETALATVVGGATRVVDTGDIRSIGWHPTEDRIVYLNGEEVVTVDADGSGRTVLPLRAEAVTWRPGRTPALVAAVREPDGLVVVSHSPDGRDPERLSVPLPVQRAIGMDYDPVGAHLALTTSADVVNLHDDVAVILAGEPLDAPLSW